MWPMQSPSTDSLDASELDSVLFSRLQTDMSESPSIMHFSESGSPGPNTEFRMIRKHGNYSRDDDNDSLSSVSTTSSSSALRIRRRPKGSIINPSLNGHTLKQHGARMSASIRKFHDADTDYISDSASVASGESAKVWYGGNSALSKLQQQQEQLKQLKPLVQQQAQDAKSTSPEKPAFDATTSISGSASNNSAIKGSQQRGFSTVESPAIKIQPNRTSSAAPTRAASVSASATSPTTAVKTTPGKGEGLSSKPRATTPTNIPRAVTNTSGATPKGKQNATSEGSNADSASSPVPPSSNSKNTRASSEFASLKANKAMGSGRSASVERSSQPASSTLCPSPAPAAAPRTTPAKPSSAGATSIVSTPLENRGRARTPTFTARSSVVSESPAPAASRSSVATPSSNILSNQTSSAAKRPAAPKLVKEIEHDPYPERGRMRLRSGSNARTSTIERLPAASNSSSSLRANPQEPKPANSPVVRERSASRGASTSRALNNHSSQTTLTSTSSSTNSAPVGSGLLAKWNRPIKGVSNGSQQSQQQPTSTQKTPVRSSFGSSNSSAPKANNIRSPPPTINGQARRQSTPGQQQSVSVSSPVGRTVTPRMQSSRTPTSNVTSTTGSKATPARINLNVVTVPTRTGGNLTKTTSSSSLSTEGSAGGSRSSTPTSASGNSSNRLSRNAPNLSRDQLKSHNPYPLRSSGSQRKSLDSSSSPHSPPFSSTSVGNGAWAGKQSPSLSSVASEAAARRRSTDGVSGIPGPSVSIRGSGKSRNSLGATGAASRPTPLITSTLSSREVEYGHGESDQESYSPNLHSGKAGGGKLIQPPPEAILYQPVIIPKLFMQSLAHLGQEAISGVYTSPNYNPCPQHNRRSPKPASLSRFSFRLSSDSEIQKLGSSSLDDADQGSGHTDTTQSSTEVSKAIQAELWDSEVHM